ncbi:MAG: pilus assembly protein [Alphaproteobacteria bacterium]|nr:pilus assembly protein [Alphaproteobacteria bacterium]
MLSLLYCRKGAVTPIIAVTIVVMLIATGVSVDAARTQMVQSKLNTATDAAGLAAGATLDTKSASAEAIKFFNVNYPTAYLGSTVSGPVTSLSSDGTTITVTASAKVPTTLLRVVGMSTLTVNASSQITRSGGGLEVVMVLDNTGSMNDTVSAGGTKLQGLKTAATDLVNILHGTNPPGARLWIGLVPFSQTVNIGTGQPQWMDAAYDATLNWHGSSWEGCVDARLKGEDVTDDPPSTMPFQAYIFPSPGSPNLYCSVQVIPMTASKDTIINGINAMVAAGNTHINLGAVWGWRMLSPRWRGVWGGEMNANALPLDYNTPNMSKALILMTDGLNTMDDFTHTAYWLLHDGRLGTTDQAAAIQTLDSRTLQVCNSLKSNGVIIYTIGFGNTGDVNPDLLKGCASQPSFFFLAPTNDQLAAAFHAIGDSLTNLRVSQ